MASAPLSYIRIFLQDFMQIKTETQTLAVLLCQCLGLFIDVQIKFGRYYNE